MDDRSLAGSRGDDAAVGRLGSSAALTSSQVTSADPGYSSGSLQASDNHVQHSPSGGPSRVVSATPEITRANSEASRPQAEVTGLHPEVKKCPSDPLKRVTRGDVVTGAPDVRESISDAATSDDEITYFDKTALLSMERDRVVEVCLQLQSRHRALRRRATEPRSAVTAAGHVSGDVSSDGLRSELGQLSCRLKASENEVVLTREALGALKADRKRLKAEKFELLNQMKQLYQTIEDKESELREFIRNYEQRIQEANAQIGSLTDERDSLERERWSVLKRAREEGDRCVALAAQLDDRETQLMHARNELKQLRRRLSQTEGCSDGDVSTRAGLTPSSVPSSALSPATSGPGPVNGRGSSADSGVRVSSDRDSVVAGNLSDSTNSGDGPVGHGGSQVASPLTVPDDCTAISRSAEQLNTLELLDRRPRPRGVPKQSGTWGSISRVFSRQKQRKQLPLIQNNSNAGSAWPVSPLTEAVYAEKLRLLEAAQQLPMERWKASMVLAWVQVTLGMTQYGPACAENVRSGKVMLELTDSDLERVLGIVQPFHKKKLRLAIEELRHPHLCKYPYISQLNHAWVAAEWLPDVGLPQLAETFSNQLIDGRLLAHLTKREMEKQLCITRKLHQASLMHGIQLLRLLQFDRQNISERRQRSEISGGDVLVWTNDRLVQWAREIDLEEYAENLRGSGMHGALLVLELSFGADNLSTALGIPQSKTMLRRHLATELEKLVAPARQQLDDDARQARWQRERLGAGGSATLGRAFSRSYASGLQRRADSASGSLRGSLSRALGMYAPAPGGASTPEPVHTPTSPREVIYARPREPARPAASPQERPQSVVTVGGGGGGGGGSGSVGGSFSERHQHRRVKSISDMESVTTSPPV